MKKVPFALVLAVALIAPEAVWAQDEADAEPKDSKQAPKQKKSKNKKKDVDAIGERDVGSGINFYSLPREIAYGKQLAQQVALQAKMVDDPLITEFVNRVGQNLARNSDSKVPLTIQVIDSEEPNALSLPGGFFFVNSGLILLADTESEMAGAM